MAARRVATIKMRPRGMAKKPRRPSAKDAKARRLSPPRLAAARGDAEEAAGTSMESELRHKRLFDNLRHGVLYMGVDGGITSANPAAERILGLSLREMRGRGPADSRWMAVNEDGASVPGFHHFVMAALESGGESGGIMGVRNRRDSQTRWIKVHATAERAARRGRPSRAIVTFEDVTELKRARDEAESWAKFPAENPSPVFRASPDGTVIRANKPAEVFLRGIGSGPREKLPEKLRLKVSEALRSEEKGVIDVRANGRVIRLTAAPVTESGYVNVYGADVTEEELAHDAVRESEERFRAIATSTPDHILVQDRELRYRWVLNPQIGLRAEDMLGRTDYDILPREDADRLAKIKRGVIRTGKPVHVTVPVKSNTGEEGFFEGDYIPRRSPDGRVNGIIGYFRNVTELRKTQDALTEANENLMRAQRVAHIGSWENHLPTNNLAWSEEMYRILGFEPGKPVNLNEVAGIFPPEELKRFQEAVDAALNRGEKYSMDYRIVRPDGEERFIHDEGDVIRDGEGKPVWMYGTTQDITGRKKAEEALREAKEYSENLVRTANTIVVGLDAKGEVNLLNEAAERIMGYGIGELRGRNWFEVVVPRDRYPNVWEEFKRLRTGGVPRNFENPVLTKSGDERYIIWQNSEVLEHGRIVGTVSFGLDVTERRRAEEALRESEESFRSLFDNMASGVAVYEAVDGGRDFVIRDFNRAAERIENARRQDVIGKPVTEAFPGVKDLGLLEILRRVWMTGKAEHHPAGVYKDERIVGWRENQVYKLPSGQVVAVYDDVTEKKKAEDALAASETKYRRLFEAAKDGVLILDAETGEVSDVNPYLEELLGYTRIEFIGKRIWELGAFKDVVKNRDNFKELQEKEYIRYEDLPLETADGRSIDVEFVSNVYNVDHHKVIQCNIRNITDRKRAAEALKEAHEKLVRAQRVAHIGSWENDLATNELTWSQEMYSILGFPPGTPVRLDEVAGVFPQEELERFRTAVEEAVAKGAPYSQDYRIIRPDGTERHIHDEGEVVRDRDGKPQRMFGTTQDITERKLAEEAAAYESSMRMMLLENLPCIALILRKGTREIVFSNETARAAGAYPGRTCYETCAHRDSPCPFCLAPETWAENENRRIEVESNGRYYEGRWMPLNDELYVHYIFDITDRKKAEEALREKERDLVKAQEVANVGSWKYDVKTRMPSWSKQMFAIFGLGPEDKVLDYDGHRRIIHPDDWKTFDDAVQKSNTTGEGYDLTIRVVRPSGELRWINTRCETRRDGSGKVAELYGTCQDITALKDAQAEAEKAYRMMSSISDGSTDAIYVKDLMGRYLLFNEAAAKVVGKSPREVIGKDDYALFPPAEAKVVMDGDRAIMDDRSVKTYEETVTTVLGVRTFLSTKGPTYAADGSVTGLFGVARDITERKLAEDRMRETRDMMDKAESIGKVGSWRWDLKTRKVTWSDEMFRIFGVEKEGFDGDVEKVIDRAVHPDDREKLRASNESVFKGKPAPIEYRIVRPDGEVRHVWGEGTLVFDGEGKPAVLTGLIQDITDRKSSQEALKASEEKYRMIFDSTDNAILTFDMKANVIAANRRVLEFSGLREDELVGKSLLTLLPRFVKDGRAAVEMVSRAFTHHDLLRDSEWRVVNARGEEKTLIANASRVVKDGRTVAVTAILTDITERKRAEEALTESRHLVDRLLSTTPDLMYIYDLEEGRNVYANREITSVLGYSPAEVQAMGGRLMETVLHPDDAAKVAEHHRKLMAVKEGEILAVEYRMRHRDGGWRWLYSQETPFKLKPDGSVKQIVGSALDVTEKKAAEEQMLRSLAEKDLLLREIHHRVKNNLQVISSLISLQSMRMKDSQDEALFKEGVDRVKAMATIHERLYHSADVGSIAFGDYARELGETLIATYRMGMAKPEYVVETDGLNLDIDHAIPCGLILNELVTNSLKHAFPDGRAGVIRVDARADGADAVISVRDDGRGLPEGFTGAANTLGLHIVDMLVKQLDGTLAIDRRGGTAFTLRFKNIRE